MLAEETQLSPKASLAFQHLSSCFQPLVLSAAHLMFSACFSTGSLPRRMALLFLFLHWQHSPLFPPMGKLLVFVARVTSSCRNNGHQVSSHLQVTGTCLSVNIFLALLDYCWLWYLVHLDSLFSSIEQLGTRTR